MSFIYFHYKNFSFIYYQSLAACNMFVCDWQCKDGEERMERKSQNFIDSEVKNQ